ncbi:MAG: heat-inducible transcription repressor HrcA [Candidatus Omnitrophica bacterium]|nr:heat-inducible transcription repressor HrcA [Candidatus Omnitrophota bacterium]
MSATLLDTRRKKILQAIVERYIETASAVSSEAVAKLFRWRVSSATIRNVMAELSEAGFIWQAHTSGGRIPTDKAYRYYIDALLDLEQLTAAERQLIESQYLGRNEVFDELLREVLRILSHFVGYTAIAFSSGLRKILFKKLEFVSVESTKLLVVLVSADGAVKTTVVQLPYQIEQEQLFKIARFLSDEFSGLTLGEVKERLAAQLLASSDSWFHLLRKTADILELIWPNFDKDELYLEGANFIFAQPEFQNSQNLQAVLRTFSEEQPLLEIMKESLEQDGVSVHIGKENPYQDIHECSLVICNFKNKNSNIGALGVIGPRRMSYSKAISTVRYVARIFSESIAGLNL